MRLFFDISCWKLLSLKISVPSHAEKTNTFQACHRKQKMLSESLERLTLRGDEKALRSALKQQQRSSSSSSLYFPLKLAAEHGLLNIVKLFVEEGKCNMNQQDSVCIGSILEVENV